MRLDGPWSNLEGVRAYGRELNEIIFKVPSKTNYSMILESFLVTVFVK